MEDSDVLPWSLRPRGYLQTDPLARALARQYNHWIVNRRVTTFYNHSLATLSQFLENRDDSLEDEFSPIVAQLRSFLSDAGKMPRSGGLMIQKLKDRARDLSRVAKAEAPYDQTLTGVSQVLDKLVETGEFAPDIFAESAFEGSKAVTILCRSKQEAFETTSMLQDRGISGAGLTAAELFRDAPVEHLVVPGWHGAETMRRLDTATPAVKLDYFLFDFQEHWFNRVTGAVRKWARTFNSPIERSSEGHQPQDTATQLVWPSPPRYSTAPIEDQEDFVPAIEKRRDLDRMLEKISGDVEEADVSGIPVILDDYMSYMILPQHADLVLVNRDVRRPEDACIAVSQLREGDVFILKDGSHRELFQELALSYLSDPSAVLAAADLWRQPLKASYEAGSVAWSQFRKKLAENGLQRTAVTYRNWLSGHTLAPLNYREVIPTICSLSDDPKIKKSGETSTKAVAALYEARQKAAAHVFEQLAFPLTF